MSEREEPAPTPQPGPTPVVKTLLAINIAIFLAELLLGPWLIAEFGLWPAAVPISASAETSTFAPWQLLTYGFLHGGLSHLFLNMFALWMFGSQIEYAWGSRRFLSYYLICIVGAGIIQLYVATAAAQHGDIYPTIGASGAVFGILLAFGMMFPNTRILLLLPPIPVRAKWFVLGYGVLELWAGITGSREGVAHFAHLGGMVVGFVLIQFWRGKLPLQPRSPMRW